jgi:hypothetical protein
MNFNIKKILFFLIKKIIKKINKLKINISPNFLLKSSLIRKGNKLK